MHTQQTKIGPARKVPHQRIWIEGRHLKAAGFNVGDRYDRVESKLGGLILLRATGSAGQFKVSGKADKPIIDITGAIVPRLFPQPATHVRVEFDTGHISIIPIA
jgi:hypothetical protein